jgi:hypothetical protein
VVDFEGPMIGNKRTCQAQGYFIVFGMAGGGSLYMCLSWYFVLSITFKMKLDTIKRWVEPSFYLYSIVLALFVSSYYLSKNLISIDMSDPFCSFAKGYSSCYSTPDGVYMCIDDDPSRRFEFNQARTIFFFLVAITVGLILLAMMIILITLSKQIIDIKSAIKAQNSSGMIHECNDEIIVPNETLIKELRYSRIQIVQALMYIASNFLTWMFMIIPMILDFGAGTLTAITLDVLKTILFPMQGVWNLIIFVYDKVYIIRQVDESLTLWQAVQSLIVHPDQVPVVAVANIPFNTNDLANESGEVLSSPSTVFFERLEDEGIHDSVSMEITTCSPSGAVIFKEEEIDITKDIPQALVASKHT